MINGEKTILLKPTYYNIKVLKDNLPPRWSRALALSVKGRGFDSSQRLKNWHLLLPSLSFTIKGLEQGLLAQRQFKVTGWGIMFICGIELRCAGNLKHGL